MDSRTRLDYALFQLTPTRTRCDLVIFAGNANEKVASGLLQPFLTHLNFAKDQISKGGYSIRLQSEAHAPWFTKSTLERFVRFISTPEVLERFVTIEREIAQIENSIQSKEQRTALAESERNVPAIENTDNAKYFSESKVEPNGNNDALHDENSKVHLHRVLETRKAVLHKEQAMVFARALVAGFEMDYLNDLICFADAFGSPRLREACISFMDLCKKKNSDRVWRDEVAAIQAFSPSEFSYLGASAMTLSGEDRDPTLNVYNGRGNGGVDHSASASTINHRSFDSNQDNSLPTSNPIKYMQQFQGPMFQKYPPYQGHLFPGIQTPPYYHGNMTWPPNMEDPGQGLYGDPNCRNAKSFPRRNKKLSHEKGRHAAIQDSNFDESDSSSGSQSDAYEEDRKKKSSIEKPQKRRQAKSSSRKVVIRNINYITSKRDGDQGSLSEGDATEDDGSIKGYSLKQQVKSHSKKKQDGSKQINNLNGSNGLTNHDLDDEVESNPEGEKKTEHWDIFQNLIMRDVDSSSNGKELQPLGMQGHVNAYRSGKGAVLAFDMESEKVSQPRTIPTDSFVMTHRSSHGEGENYAENFETDNDVCSVIKRDSTNEEELFTHRTEELKNFSRSILSEIAIESSTIRSQKEGDFFMENLPDKSANISNGNSTTSFVEGHFQYGKNTKDVFVVDSLVFQSREGNKSSDPQQRTDLFMAAEIVGDTEVRDMPQELAEKVVTTSMYEPNDLCMVLERDTSANQAMTAWSLEMAYANDVKTAEAVTRHSDVGPSDCVGTKLSSHDKESKGKANGTSDGKGISKVARSKTSVLSLGRSKSEILARSKKSSGTKSMVQKSKSEMEEEKRKNMEELRIQRQKRIAERSGSSGFTPTLFKKPLKDSKTNVASMKNGKPKSHNASEDSKITTKPILRSSTIDRLAAARNTRRLPPTESKSGQPATTKGNGIMGTYLSQKTNEVEIKKPSLNKVNSLGKKLDQKKSKRLPSCLSNAIDATSSLPADFGVLQATPSYDEVGYPEKVKDSCQVPSVEENGNLVPQKEALSCFQPAKMNPIEGDDTLLSKTSPNRQQEAVLSENFDGSIPDSTQQPSLTLASKDIGLVSFNIEEDVEASKKLPVSPEIAVIDNFTPPPSNEMSPEPTHSRRKWDYGENSPKFARGFRKLLLFGRKA